MAFSLFIPVGQSVKMGVVEQAVVAVTPRKCLKEAQYVPGAGGDAEYHTGNEKTGRTGCTGQRGLFGQFLCILCDILAGPT